MSTRGFMSAGDRTVEADEEEHACLDPGDSERVQEHLAGKDWMQFELLTTIRNAKTGCLLVRNCLWIEVVRGLLEGSVLGGLSWCVEVSWVWVWTVGRQRR